MISVRSTEDAAEVVLAAPDGRVVAHGQLVIAMMPDDQSVPKGQPIQAQVTFMGEGTGK